MKKHRLQSVIWNVFSTILLAITLALTCFGCANNGYLQDAESSEENSQLRPDDDSSTNNDGLQNQTPPWASNFNLPDADIALSKLTGIYGDADKVFLLLDKKIVRMPCPHDEVITINVTCEIGAYAKLILEDSIAEFNEVFAFLNPHYKFAVNYSPAEEDFAKKYSIKLAASDNLSVTETSQVFGMAHVGYYNNFTELGDFGITIKSEVFNNGSYLMTTFKHELMHLLGAGDAYKNPAATKETVMQSYTVNGYHFLSGTDVAFLDALYRNPEFADEDEEILEYINTYEESSLHTKENMTAAVYNKLVSELDPATVKNMAEGIGYKDLTDFFATIQDGIKPDTTFGSTSISFKEIEYAEPPSETYFGSIDLENHRYWHGRQTSIGSSQGIKYIDYGNGILFAAPNGNQYTIMIQVGRYVVAFRLGGGFTNFADLSLTLWHISK